MVIICLRTNDGWRRSMSRCLNVSSIISKDAVCSKSKSHSVFIFQIQIEVIQPCYTVIKVIGPPRRRKREP